MPRCTATSKQSGRQCKRFAVTGWSVCRSHGANGGAPAGNKNALKTGEYETIWLDQLDAAEQTLIGRINPDALVQLDDEIRLTTIRERRMLERIRLLASVEDGFTIVERSTEHKQGVDAGSEDEDSTGSVDVTTSKEVSHATLGQIQHIEQALTRVQQLKIRLVELKARLATGDGDDDVINDLVAMIARNRQEIERRRSEAADAE